MPLSRQSVGTYQATSPHATRQRILGHSRLTVVAEPLWTDSGIKSGISVPDLIPTFKKKLQAGDEWSNIFPKS